MDPNVFSPRLRDVHDGALKFCKDRFGRNGLKIHEEIDAAISWKPSFYLKASAAMIIAVEVDDTLDPAILKLAAHEISHYEKPIAVALACPLEVYMADVKQAKIAALRKNGFGVITVDDSSNAIFQQVCVPLAQHISDDELKQACGGLPPRVKVAFKNAHTTFLTNVGQGLQEAGQIVEAFITCLGKQSIQAGFLAAADLGTTAANNIDAFYALNIFKNYRANLGRSRGFVKEYRNSASHPSQSAKEMQTKINKCRRGFFEAIECCINLKEILQDKGFRIVIHI